MTVNPHPESVVTSATNTIATPVLGFAAYSGTGKTTLLCRVIPLLTARGLRLGLVKHSHHAFEVDRPGKDSFRLRQAGAEQLVLASRRRTVVMRRHSAGAEPSLGDFLRQVDGPGLDLLLVEGYKRETIPKIEVHRPSLGHPLLAATDPSVIAIATDVPDAVPATVPLLDINQPQAIADFIVQRCLSAAPAPVASHE